MEPLNFNKVITSLYMGSAPTRNDKILQGFFDVVLCAEEHQPQLPGVSVVRVPMPDSIITAEQLRDAVHAAKRVARNINESKPTLVTCHAGLNRSGLVCALALMECAKHYSAQQAIDLVREARGTYALSNPYFVKVLKEHKAEG